MNEEFKETEAADNGKKAKFNFMLIAKIITVVIVCLCVVFTSYGSTRDVNDSSALIFLGIGIGLAVIAVALAITIYIVDRKAHKK